MNLSIGLGVATSYLPIPAVALDPDAVIAALFSSGEEGAWYDPSDSSTVWQDAAGTTPAGVGDPVGRIDDKSGNGNHATQSTSAARPVLQVSGGLYYLDFDGVDDVLRSSSNISGLGGYFLAAAALQATSFNGSTVNVLTFGGFLSATNRADLTLRLSGGSFSLASVVIREGGGTQTVVGGTQGIYTDQAPHILVGGYDDTSSVYIREDGTLSNSGTRSITSTFTGYMQIGQEANETVNFYGGIYILRDSMTQTEIDTIESYLAAKSGVTL